MDTSPPDRQRIVDQYDAFVAIARKRVALSPMGKFNKSVTELHGHQDLGAVASSLVVGLDALIGSARDDDKKLCHAAQLLRDRIKCLLGPEEFEKLFYPNPKLEFAPIGTSTEERAELEKRLNALEDAGEGFKKTIESDRVAAETTVPVDAPVPLKETPEGLCLIDSNGAIATAKTGTLQWVILKVLQTSTAVPLPIVEFGEQIDLAIAEAQALAEGQLPPASHLDGDTRFGGTQFIAKAPRASSYADREPNSIKKCVQSNLRKLASGDRARTWRARWIRWSKTDTVCFG